MTDEPTSLILEHLRAIRAKLDRMDERLTSHSSEFVGLRSALSGLASLQNNDRSELAALIVRMDDLEGRASFRDAEVSELRRKLEHIEDAIALQNKTLESHQAALDSFDGLGEAPARYDARIVALEKALKDDR